MRLLFLSNTRGNSNQEVFSRIGLWLPENAQIGYIPSAPDPTREHFKEVEMFFRDVSPSFKLGYIDIHNEREKPTHLEWRLRKCDAVYLSGGNTFHFLKAIRDSRIDLILKSLAGETVFIGTSAGGLIMTPSIELASGENDIGLENTKGLALVRFGFYPHFNPQNSDQLREIKSYLSEMSEIYALPELSGLAVTETETIPLGPVYHFRKGIKEHEIIRSPIKTNL